MRTALLFTVLLALAGFAACKEPAPRPASGVARDVEAATSCAGCHRSQAAEWDASLHHASFTDRDFQASFALEPDPFCFRCHAPEAGRPGDRQGERTGVGCLSCHSVAPRHGSENTVAATKDCASCHEFSFPSRPALMQSTMSEHARSTRATESCSSCHLPRAADGHHDHRFDVSRNATALRASVRMTAWRTITGVAVDLEPRSVGHALPTGDLFRRLRIVLRAEDGDGRPVGEEERIMARRFDRRGGRPDEVEDTRLFGPRHLKIDAPWIANASRVDIELRYERVAQTIEVEDVRGELQRRDSMFASVVVAESSLDGEEPKREQ